MESDASVAVQVLARALEELERKHQQLQRAHGTLQQDYAALEERLRDIEAAPIGVAVGTETVVVTPIEDGPIEGGPIENGGSRAKVPASPSAAKHAGLQPPPLLPPPPPPPPKTVRGKQPRPMVDRRRRRRKSAAAAIPIYPEGQAEIEVEVALEPVALEPDQEAILLSAFQDSIKAFKKAPRIRSSARKAIPATPPGARTQQPGGRGGKKVVQRRAQLKPVPSKTRQAPTTAKLNARQPKPTPTLADISANTTTTDKKPASKPDKQKKRLPPRRQSLRDGNLPKCAFSSFPWSDMPFDGNGVLYHIGKSVSKKNPRQYVNPHKQPNGVVVSASSLFSGNGSSLKRFIEHKWTKQMRNCTKDAPNSFFCVDFGPFRRMQVSHYCLRTDKNGCIGAVRTWKLEGSNDKKDWTCLKRHLDDTVMPAKSGGVGWWPIAVVATVVCGGLSHQQQQQYQQKQKKTTKDGAAAGAFRFLRVFQTGKTAGGLNQLMIAGAEFYGVLHDYTAPSEEKENNTTQPSLVRSRDDL